MLQRSTYFLLFFGLILQAVPTLAQEVHWDTLEASMVVLQDNSPRPDSITNRIELPVRLRTQVREAPAFTAGGSVITPKPVVSGRTDMDWDEIREVQREFREKRRQSMEGSPYRNGSAP